MEPKFKLTLGMLVWKHIHNGRMYQAKPAKTRGRFFQNDVDADRLVRFLLGTGKFFILVTSHTLAQHSQRLSETIADIQAQSRCLAIEVQGYRNMAERVSREREPGPIRNVTGRS
jgi:hypothetical protein